MSLHEPTIDWVLDRPARLRPDGVATIDLGTGERRSWAETRDRVRGLACGLRDLGFAVGDRAAVLSLNSARHYETWFAIPAAGMIMNDLNFRLAPAELAFICDDSDVKVLFVDDTFLAVGRQLVEQCASITTLVHMAPGTDAAEGTIAYDELAATPIRDLEDVNPRSDTVAAIFYTGGTTGLPKGAMLTHRNLTANALHMITGLKLDADDIYLHCGPQFHLADGSFTYGLTWVMGTHAFVPAFDPSGTPKAIEEIGATLTMMVPTMINLVLQNPDVGSFDMSSLREILYGASPMPTELQRQALAYFGPILGQGYGMTEASPLVSYLTPAAHERGASGEEPWASRLVSAGTAVVGVQVEVRRPDGSVCDPGQAGELYVQGPNIMSGYWNRDEETASALVDGWYKSGDVAYADDGGYLFIVDRAKDMIISGGENIYTTEVENAVYSHPSVFEAAVFGIPSEEWGESVHVEVVLKPEAELTDSELVDHCRDLIAGYKLPRSVTIRSADEPLPKSGAGKILKRDLREPYWEGHDRNIG